MEVHLGAGQASFRLTTSLFDDHDLQSSLTGAFPPGFPHMVEVTFDIEWSGIIDSAHVTNEDMNFEGNFAHTDSTIQWSARDLVTGFQFTSDPGTEVVSAVLGHERNGVFL